MFTNKFLLVGSMLVLATGCNLLEGYYYPSHHHPQFTATVRERQFSKTIHRTYSNLLFVLRERDFGIEKKELGQESAQVRASRGGLEYIFDITSSGEGSQVHLEIDQAGNDQMAETLLTDLFMLP